MNYFHRTLFLVLSFLLCLTLTGCAALTFFLSGWEDIDPNLVVINDSTAVVGSISLDYDGRTDEASGTSGRALLERGESFGFQLDEGCTSVRLRLFDLDGVALCRCLVEVDSELCLYATLREDLQLELGETWPRLLRE